MILVAVAGVSAGSFYIAPAFEWPQFLEPLQHFLASHPVGSLAMAYVFGISATLLVGLLFLRKYPISRPSLELGKSYFAFALPLVLLSIIGVLSVNVDKIMIGYFWTSTEVGYYFTVQQILNILLILSTAISTILFPTLSEYHATKSYDKIKQTTQLAERYISMVMIPPIVVIIVFVIPVINIMLSSAFLAAAPVLIALTIYTFILATRSPYLSLVSGINRPGLAAKVGAFIFVSNIVLNYLFIPRDGLLSTFNINGPLGAAFATIISSFIGFMGLRIISKKLTGIGLFQTHTPRHIIAGIIMGGVLFYIGSFFSPIQWYHW